MNRTKFIAVGVLGVLGLIAFGLLMHYSINCIYVEEGKSLMLRYKGPLLFGAKQRAGALQFAKPGEIGIQEQLLGPGRHFYCPIWWERKIVDDVVIGVGQVGVVTSMLGEQQTADSFLVDGELAGANRATKQGTLRRLLGPGRHRVHPYAYKVDIKQAETSKHNAQFKHFGWVDVPTGYVGVSTYLTDSPALGIKMGIQEKVLPPGLYMVNPKEQQVDIIEVGFRETSISAAKVLDANGKQRVDESGEPEAVPSSGIGFPSNDGFPIQLDFTAIWGVMPENAAKIVEILGTVDAAEQKVILPQCESICRNNGSKMGANELLVGETRQKFQTAVSEEFQRVVKGTSLTLRDGLIRHIYIPKEVRIPLQKGYVADELTLTREQERETKTQEGTLREAEKQVEQEAAKVELETAKMVAAAIAEGEKGVGEIQAETKQQVAAIEKQVAEMDAQRTELLGKAKAQADQAMQEALSQRSELAAKAFGTPSAFTKFQFAEQLPGDMQLQLFYAGEGTLWTDLKGMLPTLPITPTKKESTPSTSPATPMLPARPVK